MTFSEIDRQFYYNGPLGAEYTKEHTIFRVWAPTADGIAVRLYRSCTDTKPFAVYDMIPTGGVWSVPVPGDLDGIYYTYAVCIEGSVRETIDIYARTAGVNGKMGMVLDLKRTDPDGWADSKPVKLDRATDAVIYELHVRDFSSDKSGGFRYRGKFKAFTEEGVVNSSGDTIGLDYIADLGITHIHLLPVADFATVDESSDSLQFNWGYDPQNYNVPEGSYSTDPYDGAVRVRELKELVLAAHKKGLGIIMDVVYNHTYRTQTSSFNILCPGYYYRHEHDGSFSNGSGCGNEFASERKMASRYIVDSLCYLAKEYKLDGFRFDLMGLLDIDTLNDASMRLRHINPSIILYGEGWTGGSSPLDEGRRAVKYNVRRLHGYAMFSDDFRDSVKGSAFHESDSGYVNGSPHAFAFRLKNAMGGGVWQRHSGIPSDWLWADEPRQTVNYAEAHDNLTFYDKLKVSMHGASESDIIAADRIGAALIMLSQGIPFIEAGQEFLRSKPLPGGGYDHNSYRSPDSVNSLKWDRMTEHRDTVDYYRGLIAIRHRFGEFCIHDGEGVRNTISFADLWEGAFEMWIGRFVLILNPTNHDIERVVSGAVYADKDRASDEPLYGVFGKAVCRSRSILLVKYRD